jgi:hypothetical protein
VNVGYYEVSFVVLNFIEFMNECRSKHVHGHLTAPRLCHAVMTRLCVFGM